MADIRIKDLPLATGPTAPIGTDSVAIDSLTTRRTTITALGDIAVPVASQAEAEAGLNASKRMTPLTTKQSIASEVGTVAGTIAAGDDTRIVNAAQTSITLTTGSGLTGGGDLTANRSFALNSASIASLAKADSALQDSDRSTTATIGKSPKFYDIGGLGIPALQIENKLAFYDANGLAGDVWSMYVLREANYTGGSTGFLNSAVRFEVNVQASVSGPFENAIIAIANIYAGNGQHHAAAFQGNRFNQAGPGWAGVFEVHENFGTANPTAGSVGIEIDVFAAGTDSNRNRIGAAILACREGAGSTPTVDVGLKIAPKDDNNAEGRFNRAISGKGAFLEAFIDAHEASMSAGAPVVWAPNDGRITLDTANTRYISYLSGAARVRLTLPAGRNFDFKETGDFDITNAFTILGTQVVTSRRTGWTADTGTSKRTANATYSGTAEAAYTQATIQTLMNAVRDLSQTVKALKEDLTTHGLIGA